MARQRYCKILKATAAKMHQTRKVVEKKPQRLKRGKEKKSIYKKPASFIGKIDDNASEDALIMVRLALERAKENASRSSSEVVSLRRQLNQMKNTQEHLESEVNTYRSHCVEWQGTAEAQERKIHKLLNRIQSSIKDRERYHLKEEQRVELAAELAAAKEEHKALDIKFHEKLSKVHSLTTKLRRHLPKSSHTIFEILDAIDRELGKPQATLHVETSIEEEEVRKHNGESDKIPRYRMIIVKTRAKLKSTISQLHQETLVTDQLRRQVAHLKAKLVDDNKMCNCDEDNQFIGNDVEISQLKLLLASNEKENTQTRQKMVHQARMIEKMQSIIHNQQGQINSIEITRGAQATTTPKETQNETDAEDMTLSLQKIDEEIKRLATSPL